MQRTILRPEEVSEYTDIQPEALKYWRKRGEGPAYFKLGRRVFYDLTAVNAWIDAQRHQGAARPA